MKLQLSGYILIPKFIKWMELKSERPRNPGFWKIHGKVCSTTRWQSLQAWAKLWIIILSPTRVWNQLPGLELRSQVLFSPKVCFTHYAPRGRYWNHSSFKYSLIKSMWRELWDLVDMADVLRQQACVIVTDQKAALLLMTSFPQWYRRHAPLHNQEYLIRKISTFSTAFGYF